MPFELDPLNVSTRGGETVIRGCIISGAYFGPESVRLRSANGREIESHIHSHGMEYPVGWPVLPEHEQTVVILYLPLLPDGFQPVLVTGVGALQEAKDRIDLSAALSSPELWVAQAVMHFASDEVDDPALQLFGMDDERANDWYERNIERPQAKGTWPFIRVVLPDAKYIELEMSAGVEYQDRIWIGEQSGSTRVLLGYHSGHFSLPAFRPEEFAWLAAVSPSPSALLWLSATYFDAQTFPFELVEKLAERVPGVLAGKAALLAEAARENLNVPDVQWSKDPVYGWRNNSPYSQRNPESRMSVLTPDDYAYIDRFFAGV